ELMKVGGGTLEIGGTQANAIATAPRVQRGTLLLNKSPGVAAFNSSGATVVVGDDLAGAATLRFGAANQLPAATNLLVASNGTVDLNGQSQIVSGLILTSGTLGGAQVSIGAGGTLTNTGGLALQSASGASLGGSSTISGGTLALTTFTAATNATRTWQVNDVAVGVDLLVTSAIVDGGGLASMSLTKQGVGTLKFGGAVSNSYTGTTTVSNGTLLLGKTASALAMSGPLVVGDANLTGGGLQSDLVRWEASNQLPAWQAPVTVNAAGWLDLDGFSQAIGAADDATALSINLGVVDTDAGTLTLNGNLTLTAATTSAGLSAPSSAANVFGATVNGNATLIAPPQLNGNVSIGDGFARRFDVQDR
ncbi:MAG TPA: autotransporter-associated beta strand repeat-containing protein, partial [Pirellulaceae bacterium]|nr:autotransporter-associated beta strand repeat-containing protein [Pirellulaceae bacterium]